MKSSTCIRVLAVYLALVLSCHRLPLILCRKRQLLVDLSLFYILIAGTFLNFNFCLHLLNEARSLLQRNLVKMLSGMEKLSFILKAQIVVQLLYIDEFMNLTT
jgi:hypothetical protein